MPRSSQSPDGNLAARTGWIGSLARFWQVISHSCSPKASLLTSCLKKTYAPDYLGFTLLMAAYFSVLLPRQQKLE
jgi:diacylglycerol diphosphate phosphatase/phosphatidate phosphatase